MGNEGTELKKLYASLGVTLKKILDTPEMMAISNEDCLRAAQKEYGLSEEWVTKKLQEEKERGA